MSSASIMTEAVCNKKIETIRGFASEFRRMITENLPAESLSPELEDAGALEGVKKYPVRIKCALLAWHTLKLALDKYEKKSKTEGAK